jgi:hypothetical protein
MLCKVMLRRVGTVSKDKNKNKRAENIPNYHLVKGVFLGSLDQLFFMLIFKERLIFIQFKKEC